MKNPLKNTEPMKKKNYYKKMRKLYWSIGKQKYLTWEEYERIAIPMWIKKKYKDKLREHVEKILLNGKKVPKRNLILYN